MSLALVAALALSPAATADHCSWDRPGVDPFMGNIPAAVDRYGDIPADVRARLKARMAKRQYDEIATIRRDSITGRHRYSEEIRDMHFGQGRVCRTVTRTRWAPDTVERGLVYCEAEHCIIVPTVCRNVSRVTRLPGGPVAAPSGEGGLPGTLLAGPGMPPPADTTSRPLAANDTTATDELVFDPPGAGNSFAEASQPLPALPPIAGFGGGSSIPGTVGGIPIDGGGAPGRVPDSALDVPVGVPPLGGGSVGGGGVFPTPTPNDPPLVVEAPVPVIPEPATWLMWLAGLGGVAWLARRRRA